MPKLRKLKYHEQKLVKKVDFLNWKSDGKEEVRVAALKIIAKYNLRDHEEFFKYARISQQVNTTLDSIRALQGDEYTAFKREQLELVARKLFTMGIINSVDEVLDNAQFKTKTSQFCARRLSYMLKVKKFVQSVKLADNYIVHGHIRVGPEIVTDPAFVVTRMLEDYLQWTKQSTLRKTIAEYKDERDDFDLENC